MHPVAHKLFSYKKSIQAKVFLSFVAVVMISLTMVGMIIYHSLLNNIKQNASEYVWSSMRQADDNLQTILQDMEQMNLVVATNRELVIEFLKSPHNALSYETYQEQKQIKQLLSSLKAFKSYISRISIVGLNGKIVYEGGPFLSTTVLQDDAVQKIMKANGSKVWVKQSGDGSLPHETVTVGRLITYEREALGVVMIDIDYELFKKSFKLGSLSQMMVFVIDETGATVYSSGNAEEADPLREIAIDTVVNKKTDTPRTTIQWEGQNYILAHYKSAYTGWTTIGVIPEFALLRDSVKLRNHIFQGALIVFALVLLLSINVAGQITKNLRALQKTMKWVQEGNLTSLPQVRSEDEVGELNSIFVGMVTKLRGMMTDIQIQEQQKREAELTALQAQISPHFLYNTLNTIKYLARLRNAPNIEEVTTSLIKLLRGVVGNTRQYITIEEELSYVRSYINIQKYKDIHQLDVHWHVDPELLHCRIVKMLVQPIVENAMIHGFKKTDEERILTISVQKQGTSDIMIEVTDNGIGMTAEQIENIVKGDRKQQNRHFSGIGISNVHERIQMVFGESYGVQISSEPELYTTVMFTIPYISGGDA